MSAGWLETATLVAVVGSGLMAGFFFTFSNLVMTALGQRPPAEGIAAMQAINRVVLNPLFFLLLFGTAALSLLLAIVAASDWQSAASAPTLAGAICYLLGIIGVTVACNVPRNEKLAKLESESDEAVAYWAIYRRDWTRWNHLRTIGGTLATGCYAFALL